MVPEGRLFTLKLLVFALVMFVFDGFAGLVGQPR